MLWLVLVVIGLLTVAVLGSFRITRVRRPNVEGLGNPAAARAYDRLNWWPQYNFIQPRIVSELKKYRPAGTLVDAGCGPGYLDAVIARELPQLILIGMDIAPEMVRVARQNLTTRNLGKQVAFLSGNVRSLPFKDNSIDFVVSTFSLHHWADAKQAMRDIYRVLKSEGQFLFMDLRRDSPRWCYWLLKLGQIFVVPVSLRRFDGPADSLLASYTPREVDTVLSETPFSQWQIKGSTAWMLIWGRK